MKKENLPLVSIGIPVFNGDIKKNPYSTDITKSLTSILNQSYKNIEIIISDNASTDNTPNIIKKLCSSDQRIKYYRQPNIITPDENFNFVLEKSNGKYFKWNCHDDFISHDFIEKNIELLEKNEKFVFSSSPSCFDYEFNVKKNNLKFDFNLNLYERIKYFYKIRSYCHSMFYGLIRKKNLENRTDITKCYFAMDWIIILELLFQGRFQTIDDGYIIIGSTGVSTTKAHLDNPMYHKKKIYYFMPYFELNLVCIKKTFQSKKISFLKKLYLTYISLRLNILYFIYYKLGKRKKN